VQCHGINPMMCCAEGPPRSHDISLQAQAWQHVIK